MAWQPVQGKQLLAPFGHQVAGQSSMLWYDATTVCKPLIPREHFVYKTLPKELKEFTPEYRGEIEVELQEQDGYIHLYGLPVDTSLAKSKQSRGTEDSTLCPCSDDPEVTSSPEPDQVNFPDEENLEKRDEEKREKRGKERCVIRVLRSGSYEVSSSLDEVFYTSGSQPNNPSPHNHKKSGNNNMSPPHTASQSSHTQRQHTQNINPWSLKNHKRLLDKMRKSEHNHNSVRCILLKNVVAGLKHPCILDLKIGSRLHADDASHKKVASQSHKCNVTTSSSLGVRLCGMQVYQADTGIYKSLDKYYGRTLNDASFKATLHEFLHNGFFFRSELLPLITSRLTELISCLESLSTFRFYASSLLIIYAGEASTGIQNHRRIPVHRQRNQNTQGGDQMSTSEASQPYKTDGTSPYQCRNMSSPSEKLSQRNDVTPQPSSHSDVSSKHTCRGDLKTTNDHGVKLSQADAGSEHLYHETLDTRTLQNGDQPDTKTPNHITSTDRGLDNVKNFTSNSISRNQPQGTTVPSGQSAKPSTDSPSAHPPQLSSTTSPSHTSALPSSQSTGGSYERACSFTDDTNTDLSHTVTLLKADSNDFPVPNADSNKCSEISYGEMSSEHPVTFQSTQSQKPDQQNGHSKLATQTGSSSEHNLSKTQNMFTNPTCGSQRQDSSSTSSSPPPDDSVEKATLPKPQPDMSLKFHDVASLSTSSSTSSPTSTFSTPSPMDTVGLDIVQNPASDVYNGDITYNAHSAKKGPSLTKQELIDNKNVTESQRNLPLNGQNSNETETSDLSQTISERGECYNREFQGRNSQGDKENEKRDWRCSSERGEYNNRENANRNIRINNEIEKGDRSQTIAESEKCDDEKLWNSAGSSKDVGDSELWNPEGLDVKVDVRMIDFAHTTHSGFLNDKIKHTGPDGDYIAGLQNLVKLFRELQEENI